MSGLLLSLAGSVAEWYDRGFLFASCMLAALGVIKFGLRNGDVIEEGIHGQRAMVFPLFLTISTS